MKPVVGAAKNILGGAIMLNISIMAVIGIAVIIGLLTSVMLGIQAAVEHQRVSYLIVVILGLIVAGALVGIWYDKTSISLSVYLVIIAIWLFLTKDQNPRVMAGMIMIIPAAVLIYAKVAQLGITTATIAAIITYILALILLITAMVKYNCRKERGNSNQKPAAGDYYGYGRSRQE